MAYMCWFKDWEKGFFGIEIDRGGKKGRNRKKREKKERIKGKKSYPREAWR